MCWQGQCPGASAGIALERLVSWAKEVDAIACGTYPCPPEQASPQVIVTCAGSCVVGCDNLNPFGELNTRVTKGRLAGCIRGLMERSPQFMSTYGSDLNRFAENHSQTKIEGGLTCKVPSMVLNEIISTTMYSSLCFCSVEQEVSTVTARRAPRDACQRQPHQR